MLACRPPARWLTGVSGRWGGFAVRAVLACTVVTTAGCTDLNPSVRYSGLARQTAKPVAALKTFRSGIPDRPYADMGTVEVSCPMEGQRGFWGTVSMEGGCSYGEALQLAVEKAAALGADGVYSVTTSAGGNGNIALLLATTFRYTTDAPVAELRRVPILETQAAKNRAAGADDLAPVRLDEVVAVPASAVAPAAPGPPTAAKPSVEERLRQLKDLREKNLITADDFEKRKTQILKDL